MTDKPDQPPAEQPTVEMPEEPAAQQEQPAPQQPAPQQPAPQQTAPQQTAPQQPGPQQPGPQQTVPQPGPPMPPPAYQAATSWRRPPRMIRAWIAAVVAAVLLVGGGLSGYFIGAAGHYDHRPGWSDQRGGHGFGGPRGGGWGHGR